jgi:PadR family transcriptional regulator PadR
MNIENTQSQLKKGVLEYCILSIIMNGEVYPSEIIEKMKSANLVILEGTLYPLVESNSGPPRKYFSLTDKGKEFYLALQKTWIEINTAVQIITKN